MTTLVLADQRNPGCVIVERTRATARVRVRMRARQLDRDLARGISPDSSICLSVRAHDLIGQRARGGLAGAIRRLLDDATGPVQSGHFNVPICRSKVRRSKGTLEKLGDRLLGDGPLDARGLAQLRLLLSDGAGPIYSHPGANDLEPALQRMLTALEVQTG